MEISMVYCRGMKMGLELGQWDVKIGYWIWKPYDQPFNWYYLYSDLTWHQFYIKKYEKVKISLVSGKNKSYPWNSTL